MSIAEIKEELTHLSNAERLDLIETLWHSLDFTDSEVSSPNSHREVLLERTAKIDSGDAQFLNLDQLKERLRR